MVNSRDNFIEKATYLAQVLPMMSVDDRGSFVTVDCGLRSDTFNVVVARDLSATDQLLQDGVGHFMAKQFPMALWAWEESYDHHGTEALLDFGLVHAETHVTMAAAGVQPRLAMRMPEHLAIDRVELGEDTRVYGAIIAELFGVSDEGRQVAAYFDRLSVAPVSDFTALQLYIGRHDGAPVATGALFMGRETVGIYDIVTSEAYRRRGIGTAMFAHLLKEAEAYPCRPVVLQASADGLGIYEKVGFKPTGTVHVFENRGLLDGVGQAIGVTKR